MIRMKFPAILQKLGDEDPDFAFNLFNLVRQLKRLLTGEKLNDSIGVEHVTRVNLRSSVKSHFFPSHGQTIIEPALKKDTAGKCLKNVIFSQLVHR